MLDMSYVVENNYVEALAFMSRTLDHKGVCNNKKWEKHYFKFCDQLNPNNDEKTNAYVVIYSLCFLPIYLGYSKSGFLDYDLWLYESKKHENELLFLSKKCLSTFIENNVFTEQELKKAILFDIVK